MHLPFLQIQSFKFHHLFILSFIVLSILHPGCARPSPSQANPYTINAESLSSSAYFPPTSISEHSPSQNNSHSTWMLERRMTRSCDPLPLVPETWDELGLDDYLKNYPNGDKIHLTVSGNNTPEEEVKQKHQNKTAQNFEKMNKY
jgi:hypothetical protein